MARYIEYLVLIALMVVPLWVKLDRMKHPAVTRGGQTVIVQDDRPVWAQKKPVVDPALPLRKTLFIGNSYTFYNEMPAMIPWIAASVPGQKYRWDAEMIVKGGWHLMQHAKTYATLEKIVRGGYAFVVLQEQSTTPLFPQDAMESVAATRALADNARLGRAVPVIYGTWPRRQGNEIYIATPASNFVSPSGPDDMMKRLDEFFRGIEGSSGSVYAPVGLYWMHARPYFDLYNQDGSHPSLAGSYLAALVLYYTMSGDSPADVHWTPQGLDEKEAAAIRALLTQ
jgi:hypothetical protein